MSEYTCRYCLKKYKNPNALKKHYMNKHNECVTINEILLTNIVFDLIKEIEEKNYLLKKYGYVNKNE